LPGPSAAALVGLSLVAAPIPPASLIVGRFAIFRLTRLTDTYWPLVAPALIGISPVLVLLYAWGYRRVPRELYETSRIDGLTELQTWWRVGVPLVRRLTVAASLFAFVLVWGDFIGPLIYLSDPWLFTLPLALRSPSGLDVSDQPLFLAAAAQAAVVLISLFQLGEGFVLALAARLQVPAELYEAAAVEGLGPLRTFGRVTLPLMLPALALLLFRDTAYSLQVSFAPALLVTEGGPPPYATTYLPLFVYRNAFEYLRYGYASSAAVVMFALTAAIVWLQYRIVRRWRATLLPES
jgi:ABC-type sugar transport system permease subunit